MSPKTLILITGANQGIGLALTKALAATPHTHVLLCTRSLANGHSALSSLPDSSRAHISLLELDVTSPLSVAAAAAKVKEEHGALDVLINNAGVFPDIAPSFRDTSEPERMRAAFEVNVLGVHAVTSAFAPLLQASKAPIPRVVMLSSGGGSISRKLENERYRYSWFPAYACSKAALNMLSAQFAMRFEAEAADADAGKAFVRVNAVCPGGVKTQLSGFMDGLGDVESGTVEVLRVVREGGGETGTFSNREGRLGW